MGQKLAVAVLLVVAQKLFEVEVAEEAVAVVGVYFVVVVVLFVVVVGV